MYPFQSSGPRWDAASAFDDHRCTLRHQRLFLRSVTQVQRRVNARAVEMHGTGSSRPNVVRFKPWLVPGSDSEGAVGKTVGTLGRFRHKCLPRTDHPSDRGVVPWPGQTAARWYPRSSQTCRASTAAACHSTRW
jgi:hypothetical protein